MNVDTIECNKKLVDPVETYYTLGTLKEHLSEQTCDHVYWCNLQNIFQSSRHAEHLQFQAIEYRDHLYKIGLASLGQRIDSCLYRDRHGEATFKIEAPVSDQIRQYKAKIEKLQKELADMETQQNFAPALETQKALHTLLNKVFSDPKTVYSDKDVVKELHTCLFNPEELK